MVCLSLLYLVVLGAMCVKNRGRAYLAVGQIGAPPLFNIKYIL